MSEINEPTKTSESVSTEAPSNEAKVGTAKKATPKQTAPKVESPKVEPVVSTYKPFKPVPADTKTSKVKVSVYNKTDSQVMLQTGSSKDLNSIYIIGSKMKSELEFTESQLEVLKSTYKDSLIFSK